MSPVNPASASALTPSASSAAAMADLQRRIRVLERGGASGGGGAGSVADATTVTKGKLQLSGDLGGTAGSPTVKNKLPVFDIEDYGAVGDGSLTANTGTDNTITIQAAINAAIAAGGGIVFVPKGVFRASALTADASNIVFMGTGHGSVIKQSEGVADNVYLISVNGATATPANNLTGIQILNLQLRGTCDVVADYFDAAKQHIHLIRLSAVSNVIIKDCLIKGFRGDGIYLQGDDSAAARHNENVKVINCTFDGVNNENRNGISVIDCNDFLCEGCRFYRVAHLSMPGAIDFEPNPNNNAFAILRHCRVKNCHFEEIEGLGIIALYLWDDVGDFADGAVQDFEWSGNHMRNSLTITAFVVHSPGTPNADTPYVNVRIAQNSVRDIRASWDVEGVHGVRIGPRNVFHNNRYAGFFGYHTRVRDGLVDNNDFIECGTFQGYVIGNYAGEKVHIESNQFHNCGVFTTDTNYPYGSIFRLETATFGGTVDTGTDVITLTSGTPHGMVADQEVQFALNFRDYPGATMPSPLVNSIPTAATTYYIKSPTSTGFQVAAAPGGAAINLTTTGTVGALIVSRPIGRSSDTTFTSNTITNGYERAVTVSAATDFVTLDAHGYVTGDKVLFRSDTLPAPLVKLTAYYVRDETASTFKVAATSGGAAIAITTDGADVFVSQGRTTVATEKASIHEAETDDNRAYLNNICPGLYPAYAGLDAYAGLAGEVDDATTIAKGVVQLAGHLAGTAAVPIIATTATPQITKLTLDAGAATDTQHDYSQALVGKWREELQASGRFRFYDITNSREVLRFSTAGQIRMAMNVNGFGNFRIDPETAWAAQTAGGAQYRMLYVGDSGYSGATAGTRGDAVNTAGPNDGAFSTFSPYFSGHVNWDSVGSFTSFGSSIHVKRPTHYSSKSIASWADQGGSFQATVTAHGYSNGDTVLISSVTGTTTPNGSRVISNVTANTFTIPVTYATGAITGKAAKATTGPAYSEANAFNGYTFLSSKGGYANCGEWLMAVNSTTEGWNEQGYTTTDPALVNAGPAQGVGWFNIFKEYNSYSTYNDAATFNAESWRTGGARNIWLQSTGTRRIGTGVMMTSSQDVQKDDGTDLAAGVSAWVRAMVLRSADATPRDIFCLDGESRMGFGVTTDQSTTLAHRITVGYTNAGVASTVEADGFCLGGDIKLYRTATGFLKLKDSSLDVNTEATTFSSAAGAVSGVYLSSAGRIDLTRSNSTQEVLRIYGTPADANPTVKWIGSGDVSWGPGGGTAPDTTLSRTAVGELSINGTPIGTGGSGFITSLGAETDPASIDHTVASGVLTSIIPTTATPRVTALGIGVAAPAGGIAVLSPALGQSTTAGVFIDAVTSPGRISANVAANGVYIQMFSTSTTNVGARARFHQNNTTKQVNLAFSDGGTGDDGGGAGQGTAFVTIGKVLGASTLICSNNFEVTSGLVTSTLSVSGASTLTGLLTVSAGIFVPGGSDRSIVFGENTSAPGATASQAKVYADDSGGVTRLRSRFGSNDRVLMRDVAQPAAIASPTGGAVADTQARAAIDLIRQALIDNGHTA